MMDSKFGVYDNLADIPTSRELKGKSWSLWKIFTHDEVFLTREGKAKSPKGINAWITRMSNLAWKEGNRVIFVRCKVSGALYELIYVRRL